MPEDSPHPDAHGPAPSRRQATKRRHHFGAVGFTVALLALIALSVGAVAGWLMIAIVVAVGLVVGVIHQLFPSGRFFTLALANFIGIYACIFIFFVESQFSAVHQGVLAVGFALPLLCFLAGVLRRREAIRRVVSDPDKTGQLDLGRALVWVLPVVAVGIGIMIAPAPPAGLWHSVVFLGAMGAIGLVVLFAAEDVAVLLLDSGILFEEFFAQIRQLVEPAFAFLTFYSLLVIVFAALYTVLDRFSAVPNFQVHGAARDILFSEALYFSVITLSTVGYGDVFPLTDGVRMVVALQVVSGVLLLLFGFNAIFSYSTDRRRRPHG